jgi:site-specific DNA-cytosine methylase
MEEIKYASVIPLIGGMTIGNREATGKDPEFFASYDAFLDNERLLHNYMPNVKKYDIEKDDISELKGQIQFASTVCPCAGLSMMNASNRGADAPQNEWMFKSAHAILEKISPEVFFGENAPGLYSNLGKNVADKLYEIGKQHGYSFSLIRTNTALHGIPQNRIRTFYFYWKGNRAPIMNFYKRDSSHFLEYLKEIPADAMHHEPVSEKQKDISMNFVKEKLGEENIFVGSSTVDLIFKSGLYESYLDYLSNLGEQDTLEKMKYIKSKLDNGKGYWDGYPHLVSKEEHEIGSVTGRSMDRAIHPVEKRAFTYREYMHLMGMPHDFELLDPKKDLNKIAQNVPTCTARDWTYEVIKFIKGELQLSNTDYLRQNNITQITENTQKKVSQLF